MFEKVLHHNWPAPTIAWGFERRLLQRIATAYKILKHLLRNTGEVPDLGTCRSVHTASTKFGKYPVGISPDQEDACWTGEVADLVQAMLHLTTSGNGAEMPNIIASTRRLCAAPSTSSPIPERRLPTAEVSTQLINTDHLPSPRSPSFSDPKDMCLSGRRAIAETLQGWQDGRSTRSSPGRSCSSSHAVPQECCDVPQGGSGEFQRGCKNYVNEVTSAIPEPQATDQSLAPFNTMIADQELTTRLPRDPDKKLTAFHASS